MKLTRPTIRPFIPVLLPTLGRFVVQRLSLNKVSVVCLVILLCSVAQSGGSTKPVDAALAQRKDDRVYIQDGAYWTIEDGYQAVLNVSNTTNQPLSIRPILYNASGAALAMDEILLGPHEHVGIDIGQWLAARQPAPGESFISGSLRLEHRGRNQFDLAALIMMTNGERSLRVDVPVLVNQAVSSRLEGLWWRWDQASRVRILLTNVSDEPLAVRPSFYVEGAARPGQPLALSPHECRELNLTEGLGAGAGSVMQGGLTLEHTGPPGSLMARGLVEDPERGFSSNLVFLDPEMPHTSTLHGAQLFLGQTDALPDLPTGISFTPWLWLRNTTSRLMRIEISVNYSLRANVGIASRATMPVFTLAPQEVRRINLRESLRSVVPIPERIHAAGLEIEHDGAPGALVAHLTSVDASGNFAFDMPMVDPVDLASDAFNYPFRLDGDSRTIVVMKNTRREASRYWLRLVYEGGEYELGVQEIAPGQTVTLDPQRLQEQHIEDRQGNVIPWWVRQGQVEWGVEGEMGSVLGRAIVYQPRLGVSSSFSCSEAQQETECIFFWDTALSGCYTLPDPIEGVVGDGEQLTVKERKIGCCSEDFGNDVDITSVADYYSTNPSVATVNSSGQVTLVGPGTCQIIVSYTGQERDCSYSGGLCNLDLAIGGGGGSGEVAGGKRMEAGQEAASLVSTACPCSILSSTSVDFQATRQVQVKPKISGPTNVWWFAGQTPSGYATQITLTASPSSSSSYQWAVVAGADKVNFSNGSDNMTTPSNQVVVVGTNASAYREVGITVKVNGVTSSSYTISVRAPHRLVLNRDFVHRPDADMGYFTEIWYRIEDQFTDLLPAMVPINEKFTTGVIVDFPGTDWIRGPEGGSTGVNPADWPDQILGQWTFAIPTPEAPHSPLGTTKVHHWEGEWRVGSATPGVGRRVQTNTWQKYRDHAEHQNRVSPAP